MSKLQLYRELKKLGNPDGISYRRRGTLTPRYIASIRMRPVFQQLVGLERFQKKKIVSVNWNATLYFRDNERKASGVFTVKEGVADDKIREMIEDEIKNKMDDYGNKVSDYNYKYNLTILDEEQIDEKDIPMGEALYIHYNSVIDIKQSSKNCVLIAIQKAIRKKYRTPTFDDILKVIGRTPEENNLMTCNELLQVAKVYKLNVLVCNMFNKVIANYCEHGKNARGSLIAFQHNGHLYTIDPKLKKNFSKRFQESRWINDKKGDNKKPTLISLEKFREILKKSLKNPKKAGGNHPGTASQLGGNYITTEKIHIDDVFYCIKETGKLFSIHVEEGLYLKKISHRGFSLESNPYAKECLELSKKEKLKLGSLTNMSNQILPKLTRSSLSLNGLNIFDEHRMNTPINFCDVHGAADYKAYDITKCYTSCLLDIDKFPLYTVFDEPEKFNYPGTASQLGDNHQITHGFYYVDTQNSYPLCGRNWYYSELVKYCLNKNIIKTSDIRYQYIPQYTQDNHFKQPVMDIYKKYPYAKSIVNNFIGSLNCKPKDRDNIFITSSLKELACYAQEAQGFNTTPSGLHYVKYSKKNKKNCMTHRPVYSAIIDMAKIKIHKLASLVGGNLLAVKTDCIYVQGKHNIPPLSKNIGGYRIDDSRLPQYLPRTAFEKRYRIPLKTKYNLTSTLSGSTCLNGAAGTGKSYIINNQIDDRYKRAAFTNTAARNIKGSTLHTIFNIKDEKNTEFSKPLVVDEYSMIPEKIYAILLNRKINNPKSELILSGDDRQIAFIPLNIDREDIQLNKPLVKDVSRTEIFKHLVDYNKMELTKCRRADEKFFQGCLSGEYSKLCNPKIGQTLINITRTNKLREHLNQKINEEFCKDKEILFANGEVKIVEGSRWIVKESNKKMGLIKNDFYDVKDGKFCNAYGSEIPLSEFKHFELRWAMTVNKIQGQTLKENFTIWQSKVMDKRSLYTAVSRATHIGQFKFAP